MHSYAATYISNSECVSVGWPTDEKTKATLKSHVICVCMCVAMCQTLDGAFVVVATLCRR